MANGAEYDKVTISPAGGVIVGQITRNYQPLKERD